MLVGGGHTPDRDHRQSLLLVATSRQLSAAAVSTERSRIASAKVAGRIGGAHGHAERPLKQGALLMLIGSLAFIGYAGVFLFRNFAGGGFELGVETLNGITRDNLNSLNPAIMHYIGHLHVATAAFIAATGIGVAALSWWGVRRGEWWAWIAAVVSPVVGLAVALPYHYTGTFQHNWVTHLGPIYVATVVFVVGALLALVAMTRRT